MMEENEIVAGPTENASESTPSTETPKETQDHPQKVVPLAALHEERERRKEMQRRLAEMEQRTKVVEDRANQILQGLEEKTKPRPPTVDEDAVGNLRYINEKLEGLEKEKAQQGEIARRQAEWQDFVGKYQAQVQFYAQTNPDFLGESGAYAHWARETHQELMEAGYDPATAQQRMIQLEHEIASRAMQNGDNPAEKIQKLAQRRGWKAKAEKPDNEIIIEGQKAAKSLGQTAGTSPNRLTAKVLADMSEDEFHRLSTTLSGNDWRKLMGG
jgi:hypothetical protein